MTPQEVRFPSFAINTPDFKRQLDQLVSRGQSDLDRVTSTVRPILDSVRAEGDAALRRHVETFEHRSPEVLLLRDYGGEQALRELPADLRAALEHSAARIETYHRRQSACLESFDYEAESIRLGCQVNPLQRVGAYAPGGKALYPSTVLMCAVPAKVAGVEDVVLACPNPAPVVRAACYLAKVDAILDAGGAQAIAALAYGTQSVPRVDKIVGPGNLYVTAAKRLVYGEVDIDGLAGPSEILIVADHTGNPGWIAADLLSQAEHDEAAYPLLLTSDGELVSRVRVELEAQLRTLPEQDRQGQPRRRIAEASLAGHGCALVVASRTELADVATQLAVEHVAVHTEDPRELAKEIRHAGALFIGPLTPEATGDYLAGPSHVLPTGGAVRFSSPLGVYDFVNRTSQIEYTEAALNAQQGDIASIARAEGLEAHARAVEIRFNNSSSL